MSVLCLDLGGTNLRAALSETAEVSRGVLTTPLATVPAPASLEAFEGFVSGLIALHEPDALGLAVPGLVDGTICAWIPNLPWLDGADIAELFALRRVQVANDAHMALLAEAAAGSAQGVRDAILIAIGTGIGSGLLIGGKVVRGGATSFGWACADILAPGRASEGWLEGVAAGRALDRLARGIGLGHGSELIDAARRGDDAAVSALAPALAALGTALSGAVALTGARRIIVSGGVSEAIDVIAPPVVARMTAHLPPHLRDVILTPAAFGASASLAGAAIAAIGHPAWEEDHP